MVDFFSLNRSILIRRAAFSFQKRNFKEINMDAKIIYILTALVALYLIAVLVLRFSKASNVRKISPWGGMAFAFILAGLVLGQNRIVAYSLLGIGMALDIADIVIRARKA